MFINKLRKKKSEIINNIFANILARSLTHAYMCVCVHILEFSH